jgi:hypothetical protein
MTDLWASADAKKHGTDWVNKHPIVTVYLDKLAQLNGTQGAWTAEVTAAYDAVHALASAEVQHMIIPDDKNCDCFEVNDAQYNALKRKFEQSADGAETFEEFQKRARDCGDYIMLPWCGMWLGIETDGYTHS